VWHPYDANDDEKVPSSDGLYFICLEDGYVSTAEYENGFEFYLWEDAGEVKYYAEIGNLPVNPQEYLDSIEDEKDYVFKDFIRDIKSGACAEDLLDTLGYVLVDAVGNSIYCNNGFLNFLKDMDADILTIKDDCLYIISQGNSYRLSKTSIPNRYSSSLEDELIIYFDNIKEE